MRICTIIWSIKYSVQASFSIMARAACTDPTYSSTCSQIEQIVLPNQSTGATVTTFFACPDGQLRRPLFILDGIDVVGKHALRTMELANLDR